MLNYCFIDDQNLGAMKTTELLRVLDEQDRDNQVWLFTLPMFRLLFPQESDNALKMSLRRHVKSGLLKKVAKGLYANERAASSLVDRLPALVPWLRPMEFNYVSKENRLSELGLISQLPLNYLAMMTKGSSRKFNTCYGVVDFTHTERDINFILDHTEFDPDRGLWLADATLALKDLYRSGRNIELVEEQRGKIGTLSNVNKPRPRQGNLTRAVQVPQ